MAESCADVVQIERLARAAAGAGILLGLFVIVAYWVLDQRVSDLHTATTEMNIGGRQRMLMQRIANIAQSNVLFPGERARLRKDLLAAVKLMETSHRNLLEGNTVMHLSGRLTPELEAIYFKPPLLLNQQVNDFLRESRVVANLAGDVLAADDPHLVYIHLAATGSLREALDAAVTEYQRRAESRIATLHRVVVLTAGIFLVAMMAVALFIFWPIVKRHRQDALRLAISEASSRAIVDSMVGAVITINKQGVVGSFNPAARHMFGYATEEVVGNNVSMLMPESYRAKHDGYLRRYLQTGEARIIGIGREVEGKRKDGSTFPMALAVSEMHVGDEHRFVGTIQDISERRAAEEQIASKTRELQLRARYDRSHARIMSLFASTYEQDRALNGVLGILAEFHPYPLSAIYTCDEWRDKLTLAASHGAPEALKREFERGEGLVGQVIVENKPLVLEGLETGEGICIEAGIVSVRPAAVVASPISYQGGLLGVLVLAALTPLMDLDRLFMERLCNQIGVALNNLRQYGDLEVLSHQLKQRGEEIAQKNLELEEVDRMKSEFLANMSHELRTPLNAIIGFSEVLKDGVMGELSARQQEYVGDIFTAGLHLLDLINDILDLSKMDAGKLALDREELDLPKMLENSLSIVKDRAMARRIGLELDIGEGVGNCWLDIRKTKQMVYNLLSNAVKFTPDGGNVSVRARITAAPALLEGTPEGQAFIEISVTDTGIGIGKEDLGKLFQPFSQVESSISRKFEGTGLGLLIVKRLAELHGGAVGVESEADRGSTFSIWLPYRPLEQDDGSPVAHPRPVVAARETGCEEAPRLLIVEDEDAAADLVRVHLEGDGYRTYRASTAEQALEMLAGPKPDLIILDVLLPGMDGWDFLAAVKRDEATAHIPVVVMSIVAKGNEGKGFSLGAAQVLPKPVRKRQLLDAIAQIGFASRRQGTSVKVLVVDDDPKAVEVVARHLESEHCVVLRAYGGGEGIDAAIHRRPDLIVLDLMMPEVTGFDVVHALKNKKETANIPIILLTAKLMTEEERRALDHGVLIIVEKSAFDGKHFLAEVHALLKNRKADR